MSEINVDNIQRFIDSIELKGILRSVNSIFNKIMAIGCDNLSHYNLTQLENLILDLKPNNQKNITHICYILGLYAKWMEKEGIIDNDNLYQTIKSVSRSELWEKAKPSASKRFISHKQYEKLIEDINNYEAFNSLYFQTLFTSLYEGIYSRDMSVVKNLRASDIYDNIVTLRCDNGDSYDLEISHELAKDLKKLSIVNVWERNNRFGIHHVIIEGEYFDSCFKIEKRKNSPKFRVFSYYSKLRNISNNYLDNNILPLNIFVSGIMYRIRLKLEENGISLKYAFLENHRDKLIKSIVLDELSRCNYKTTIGNFREMVVGHLDEFLE